MTQTLSREQINLAFDAWRRDTIIAGIAPADWQERIDELRTMALSSLDAYERGLANGLVKAADRLTELTGHADGARLLDLSTSLKQEARALAPGEWVAVPADWLRSVAGLHLRDVNGGKANFAASGHDVAPLVHEARALIAAAQEATT